MVGPTSAALDACSDRMHATVKEPDSRSWAKTLLALGWVGLATVLSLHYLAKDVLFYDHWLNGKVTLIHQIAEIIRLCGIKL